MAYIATDLDAYDDAQGVAGVVSFGPHGLQQVLGGLSLMWRWCWRNKTDRVTSEQVAGFFCYPAADLRGALAAFGFLELGPESHRVRGVARYLHLSAARSAAGKVRAANAKRGKKGRLESSTPPAHAGQPTSASPAADQPLQRRATSDERRGEQEDLAGVPPALRPIDVCDLWQAVCVNAGLPKWLGMSKTRDTAAKARIREHPERGWWETVMLRVVASPFLRGENDRGWRANPDWLLRPGVAESVLEGKYAGRAVSGHQARRSGADPNQGIITREEREETAAEIEEANRRSEEFINGG